MKGSHIEVVTTWKNCGLQKRKFKKSQIVNIGPTFSEDIHLPLDYSEGPLPFLQIDHEICKILIPNNCQFRLFRGGKRQIDFLEQRKATHTRFGHIVPIVPGDVIYLGFGQRDYQIFIHYRMFPILNGTSWSVALATAMLATFLLTFSLRKGELDLSKGFSANFSSLAAKAIAHAKSKSEIIAHHAPVTMRTHSDVLTMRWAKSRGLTSCRTRACVVKDSERTRGR